MGGSAAAPAVLPLAELYGADERLLLVPIEHLSPTGMSSPFGRFVAEHHAWTPERIALFDAAFSLYWQRSRELARRCRDWPAPRLRNVAVLRRTDEVLPYAQILNTSSWSLFAVDFNPELSDPELAAYLFAHGDRMAATGEVTEAALRNAAWWFERSDDEIARFTAAARRSPRPDAAALVALGDAIPWLREMAHAILRPPVLAGTHRPIAGSELSIRRDAEQRPLELIAAWNHVARTVVGDLQRRWRTPNRDALAALCDWLRHDVPPLVVCAQRARIVWNPRHPERLGALRGELRAAGGVAVESIHADLHVVAAKTQAFLDSLAEPDGLAPIDPEMEQGGYVFLHAGADAIGYDLHEPGIERRTMPALPYARPMLAARTIHEWAHRAVDSGWVPLAVGEADWQRRFDACAASFASVVAAAPVAVQRQTSADLERGGAREHGVGGMLARIVTARMPDWRANLLAQRYLDVVERETYVRQNVRALRFEMPPQALWRRLARYLYELQYLRFSGVVNRLGYLRHSTGFEQEFLDSRLLTEAQLDELDERVGALCAAWAVDERRFRSPT